VNHSWSNQGSIDEICLWVSASDSGIGEVPLGAGEKGTASMASRGDTAQKGSEDGTSIPWGNPSWGHIGPHTYHQGACIGHGRDLDGDQVEAEQLQAHLLDVRVNGSEVGEPGAPRVAVASLVEPQELWEVQGMELEILVPVLRRLGLPGR
jgi:hypothetical protein